MTARPAIAVSVALQSVAEQIDAALAAAAGDRVAFVLVCSIDGTSQYVSNAERADGVDLIETLLARWKAGRADIPAHYNPDLRKAL